MLPASYSLLIALACGLLALGLAWAAWHRSDRRRLAGRLAASLAAPLAFWLMAYPPLRAVPAARAEAIVLTSGYQPDTLKQLLRRLGAGTAVWTYGTKPVAHSKALGSLLTLAEQQPALHRLHLLGEGLPAAELPLLGRLPVVYYAGPAFEGFRAAAWSRQLSLGQYVEAEGSVAATQAGPAWVSLWAEGAGRDSVRLPAGAGSFHLRYQPKTAGLARYELRLRRSGHLQASEPLPLEIGTTPLPPVLLLAAVPGFEFKFLKNTLAAAGRAVALRTTVSRGLVQTEVLNQAAQSLDHLTPALLSRYAVVVADAAPLATLPGAESQALHGAIREGRLGLVVLADAAPLPAAMPARADFVVQPLPVAGATSQLLSWPDSPTPVRAMQPAQLRAGAARPLVLAHGSAPVVAARRFGLGAVVVSVVPETFHWALQGQQAAYDSFWSQLLTSATPPPAPAASWQVLDQWPRPDQPLTLRLAGTRPATLPTVQPLAGAVPAVQLALVQDTRLPEWSTAQYWPGTSGWHQVQGPRGTTHSFYVYDPAAWRGPELTARQQALAARTTQLGLPQVASTVTTVRQPWPAGWFFGLFLLAAGFLWLEEKL
ncbi:hypothetical protein [Hymenobacter sp. BRD67]|uniref:hypothetical protein n=1 Tax=Hymenobacter sp. BRD67 TaxID=2675877 RepID=UPI001567A6D2|nr:hypothetical protein [Hymenobacter sp. BRD67]QKG54408.1 hypothetical protein GKZ67_19620 [Hymenobacter sp. BRD67]